MQMPARYSERLEAKRGVVAQLQHKLNRVRDRRAVRTSARRPVTRRAGWTTVSAAFLAFNLLGDVPDLKQST